MDKCVCDGWFPVSRVMHHSDTVPAKRRFARGVACKPTQLACVSRNYPCRCCNSYLEHFIHAQTGKPPGGCASLICDRDDPLRRGEWRRQHRLLCVRRKKKFAFGEDMSRVFREGEKYKVYYCKSGVYEMVLSYEKVEFK